MTSAELINQTSGDVEYYTPPELLRAARHCMGGIDLDPASSVRANETVLAARFFTHADDGINQPWRGRVWINHPFGRKEPACTPGCTKKHVHHDYPMHGNAAWVWKMQEEFASDRVTEMCAITFACTSEAWFQPLQRRTQCMLSPRTNYYLPNGELKSGVTKGSVITYFGPNTRDFAEAFRAFGEIRVSYGGGVR